MTEPIPYRRTFARLLGFLKPYKLSLIVSIVLACGSQAAQIALVWVVGGVINKAIVPHDRQQLTVYVWTIVGLGVLKAGLMVGRRLISGRQALGVELDMRNGLYARLVRKSFRFYDTHQTGQLMSRATVDLQGVRFFLGYGLIFFFQNILVVVSVTVVLFFVKWELALIALAIVPFLIVLAYRYSRLSHPTLREVQQKLADVATVAQESIVGVHVVKAFAQEPAEQAKFRDRSEAVFGQTVRANRQRAFYVPLISFVPMLAQAAVLLVGTTMVRDGSLSIGSFVAFNLYLGMLVLPLRSLGMWIGQAQRATASGERIFQVMDEPEEVADRSGAVDLPAGPGEVRFEGVSFLYLDGRPVLSDVDLDVPAGRTIALIGHTGSGKSTLTSLVPRFYDVTAGRVTVDGRDVRDLTLASLRRAVGVISQDPFLFSATVRENIAFGAGDLPQEAVEAVARVGAGARVHRAAAARLRHRDRRARDHAVGRPAAAAGDCPGTGSRPEDPRPRRRHRVGRRLHRGADPDRPARRDGRADDVRDRASPLDHRPRRRDRRPRPRPNRRARHARGADLDEHRVPRDLRARAARAPVRRRRRGSRRDRRGGMTTPQPPGFTTGPRPREIGADSTQTRALRPGNVDAEGGGTAPHPLGGGVGWTRPRPTWPERPRG